MALEKVRVRKDLQKRVEQWAAVLEIGESRLVDDAIRFYLRFLDGKTNIQVVTPLPTINPQTTPITTETVEDDVDMDEEFDGSINL